MDKSLSKCRHLLHVDVQSEVSPAVRSAFRLETEPLARFYASLGRKHTVTVADDSDDEAVYAEIKKLALQFLEPSARAAYEASRQAKEEELEECRRQAAADAIDPEAPPAEEEEDE